MACDYSDLAKEIAWKIFLKQLAKMIAKRFGTRAAIALGAALVDGPVPVGDIIGLLLLIWGAVDTALGFGDLLTEWWDVLWDWDKLVEDVLKALEKDFGAAVLDDPDNCECFKEYIRKLVWAHCGTTNAEKKRRKKQARNELKSCIRRR